MPIPQIEGDTVTREKVIEAYEREGWARNLEFDWIVVSPRTGRPLKIKYRMSADGCNREANGLKCSQANLTFLQLRPTGVIWQCWNCGKTDGPISTDNAQVLESEELSFQEAQAVLDKTGQFPPIGMPREPQEGRPKLIL